MWVCHPVNVFECCPFVSRQAQSNRPLRLRDVPPRGKNLPTFFGSASAAVAAVAVERYLTRGRLVGLSN